MRIKKKPWADELYKQNSELFRKFPYDLKNKWHEHFLNDNPIELEIGSGKGGFITQLAKSHPQKNFVALEINEMALAYLLRKQAAEPLKNLFLVIGNALEISQYFEVGEVANLYLNFSDPWPKKKHEKRRLTSPEFLKQYQQILQNDGNLRFKTDNQKLFIYSLMTMANNNATLLDKVTFDLHKSEYNENNVWTEYETKFAKKGQPIYMLEAHFKEKETQK